MGIIKPKHFSCVYENTYTYMQCNTWAMVNIHANEYIGKKLS